MTRASFQARGKDVELNELLNKIHKEMLKCCAHSLSDNISHPSGPEALAERRLIYLVCTIHDANSMSVRRSISESKLSEGI